MKLFQAFASLAIFFNVLQVVVAAAPPDMTIGNVNTANTLFNVGLGLTNESAATNHIQISNTPGTTAGLSNDPGTSPGTTYYRFTVLAPGCGSVGNAAVSIKTSYNTDGHLTGASTVDFELAVGVWSGTHYDKLLDRTKFAVCIQADILIIDGGSNPQVVESKQFDFVITPLLNTFSVNPISLETNVISKVTTDNLLSGTTVTPTWAASSPLAPGEAVWFYLTIDTAPYQFTRFREVQMSVGGGAAVDLVTGSAIVDTALTSFELANGNTTMHLYHILLRSKFTGSSQQLALTGRANVYYATSRRLYASGADSPNTEAFDAEINEADFTIQAVMQPYEAEGSGGVKVEIVSMMIGSAGLAASAVFL